MKYSLKNIAQGIYLLNFQSPYDLAMSFCRYQEFYESTNPVFKGKSFSLIDFMEWYSNKNNNRKRSDLKCFTYPDDWAGFNLPSYVFDNIIELGIPDMNKYDK